MRKGVGRNVKRRSGAGETGRRKKDTVSEDVADREALGVAMIALKRTDRDTEADTLPLILEVEAARGAQLHRQNMTTSGL